MSDWGDLAFMLSPDGQRQIVNCLMAGVLYMRDHEEGAA
jgi:uncharacterized protein YjfI (DUF2170 family)